MLQVTEHFQILIRPVVKDQSLNCPVPQEKRKDNAPCVPGRAH